MSAKPSAIEAVPLENTELRLTLACGSSLQGASGIGRVLGPVAHPIRVAKGTAATPNKNRLIRFGLS